MINYLENLCHYLCASVIKVLTVLACLICIKCSQYTGSFPLCQNGNAFYYTKYRTEYILLSSSELISKILLNYMHANAQLLLITTITPTLLPVYHLRCKLSLPWATFPMIPRQKDGSFFYISRDVLNVFYHRCFCLYVVLPFKL